MYSNAKANILTRLRLERNVEQPLVESVVVDLSHFIYTAAQKPGVKIFGELFRVIILTIFSQSLKFIIALAITEHQPKGRLVNEPLFFG